MGDPVEATSLRDVELVAMDIALAAMDVELVAMDVVAMEEGDLLFCL